MRSALLMGSAAIVALATPALAAPDRYEQGYSCTGQGVLCTQQEMRLEDGNRFDEKSRGTAAINSDETSPGESQAAATDASGDDNFGSGLGEAADEAGDEISSTADEAGDEISNAADEAGDEISDAADDVGDFLD